MASSETPVYLVHAEMPDGPASVFTLLPPAIVAKQGLATHAIMGALTRPLELGETVTPDTFARNFFFVEFLHEFLRNTAPLEPACRAEAQRVGDGWIYIIDQRTPTPGGTVPPEDIIGALQVTNGQVVPDSYRRGPQHRLLSDNGFFQLSPWLRERLIPALAETTT